MIDDSYDHIEASSAVATLLEVEPPVTESLSTIESWLRDLDRQFVQAADANSCDIVALWSKQRSTNIVGGGFVQQMVRDAFLQRSGGIY